MSKTHIARQPWMTKTKYGDVPTICTTFTRGEFKYAPPTEATCGSCLRIWLWEAWKAGRLVERQVGASIYDAG